MENYWKLYKLYFDSPHLFVMEPLSERLKSLGVNLGAQHTTPKSPPKSKAEYPIERVLPGDFWSSSSGDCFYVETRYNAAAERGSVRLLPSAPLDLIASYARSPQIADLGIEQFAFMDTETTGLGTGTGTYAFMIGLGRFEAEHFVLAQFFLSDPADEPAQLAAIEEFLAPCQAWVSFNGKAFDVPVLNNRFIINGWPVPLKDAPHIDLLHLARRLWKARLPSRTLGDLEHHILGAPRSEQDVPGWMIADLYFDYLHTGDARPLLGVFYHNEMDVVSLAALLAHAADLLADPLSGSVENPIDLLSIARLYADQGYTDQAVQIYRQGLDFPDIPQEAYWKAHSELSFIYKRQGDFKSAMGLWEKAASDGQIYAHIELAKRYEHQHKDFSAALHWTQSALDIISSPAYPVYDQELWQPELAHRAQRLQRKLAAKPRPEA